MTQAVIEALRERLDRLRAGELVKRKERPRRLMAHGKSFAALPVVDPRPLEEIVDYDEFGLPR
jgi:hypothetical protein